MSELPPLPTRIASYDGLGKQTKAGYTADQMREYARAALAAQPGAVGEPIKWTLNGDKECGYNNWLGETPFGRILITWKGWKETPDACVDEFPGELPHLYGSPDDVKAGAEAEFNRRLIAAAPSAPTAVEPDERAESWWPEKYRRSDPFTGPYTDDDDTSHLMGD